MEIEIWASEDGVRDIGISIALYAMDGNDFCLLKRESNEVEQLICDLSVVEIDLLISALQKARDLYTAEQAAA
jgi:hypothetical protein